MSKRFCKLNVFKVSVLATLLVFATSVQIFAYLIQPGDTIEVQILNKKELNTRQVVAPDGTISLPFIGRTKVEGKSLDKIDDQFKLDFAKYIQNPTILVQVDQLKKPDAKSDTYYVSFLNVETGSIEVKSAKTISEAMAWTGGKAFQAYRVSKTGEKTALSPKDSILPGDFLLVDLEKSKPEPIYLAFYDQGKNLVDLKKAATVSEAMGWTAGKSYQLVKGKVSTANSGLIEPGDTLIVTIGKPDDWWGDNWYRILTGAAVVVGLFNAIK